MASTGTAAHLTTEIPVCVVEPSGNPRPLDELLPWRTAHRPGVGDPCQSCGHLAGCDDDCC